jgi:hypothetical protein
MRKKTKRKVWPLIDPIVHASYQASKLTVPEWNRQMTPVISAVDALSRGLWDRHNWQPVFECLNRIESITKLMHVEDHGLIDDAQQAYTSALLRREATGASAFKANELATLREVVEVYGNLLKEISHAQFQAACNHTNANISRILNQKAGREVGGVLIEQRKAA